MTRTIRLRVRYYWRKIVASLGWCPDCGNTLNFNSYGRPHCPECGEYK